MGPLVPRLEDLAVYRSIIRRFYWAPAPAAHQSCGCRQDVQWIARRDAFVEIDRQTAVDI